LPQKYMDRAIIFMTIAVPIGTTLAYGISSVASFMQSWQIVFYIASGLLLAVSLIWWFGLGYIRRHIQPLDREMLKASSLSETGQKSKSSSRVYICVIIAIACVAGAGNNFSKDGVVTWVPSFLQDSFNMPGYFSIMLTLLLPIVSVPGAIIAQSLYKGVKDYFVAGAILFGVSALGIGIVIIFISSSVAVTIISLAIISCAMSGISCIITSAIPTTMRGTVNTGLVAGVINSCCYIGSALATYLLGYIAQSSGWTSVFWVVFAISIAGMIVMSTGIIAKQVKKGLDTRQSSDGEI